MTRVLIADDHPIIVSGIEALLRGTAYHVVGAVHEGAAVDAAVDRLAPGILVLAVSMPGMPGLEVLERLRARGRTIATVLLTAGLSDGELLQAMRLGVLGIVLKEGAHRQLIECLDSVRSGARWIEQTLFQRALDVALSGGKADPLAPLTARERAIAGHVGHGLRNREVAERIGINEGTVKVYLHRIYRKLGIGSRTELALLAREDGADMSGAGGR